MASNNPHNFANLPKEEVRELAAKGGRSQGTHQNTEDTSSSHYNTRSSDNTGSSGSGSDRPGNGNPGNFANRPKEEVRAIASKGGQASHSGGFASMDPERQREIASMGGHASAESGKGGNFANRPREEVQEIGRKGGLSRGHHESDQDE
ncbi:stress-induced bacterial acidophilic repeat domain-containing protein [Pyronema domesticum]|uniref:Similar to Conidiation-specific protein 10 acc. no. P10713 n=1 Tax=Pyronema omphalodes (strain CBS 100304) TaxID=1076935 RepID=U4LG38_PYROM|nr:stress-induced bacterial acidophilic repeat domain-containing protein [Pyronema domesticum]CCX30507.1 Similar to Conidiation-specific protein 10; acc. no. P10713 [Pyronema omphalodes CBS 100304]